MKSLPNVRTSSLFVYMYVAVNTYCICLNESDGYGKVALYRLRMLGCDLKQTYIVGDHIT